MKRSRWFWLLVCGPLVGCDKDLVWSLPDEPLRLHRYEKGRVVADCTLLPSSSVHKALASWIAKHQTEWSASPASYVPSTIVSGSNFSLNFLEGFVVVNYPGGQYTRKVPSNEDAFLACNAGT